MVGLRWSCSGLLISNQTVFWFSTNEGGTTFIVPIPARVFRWKVGRFYESHTLMLGIIHYILFFSHDHTYVAYMYVVSTVYSLYKYNIVYVCLCVCVCVQ